MYIVYYKKHYAPMAERPNATACKTVKSQVQILFGAPKIKADMTELVYVSDLKSEFSEFESRYPHQCMWL